MSVLAIDTSSRSRVVCVVASTAGELQARLWADVNRMLDAGAPRPDLRS